MTNFYLGDDVRLAAIQTDAADENAFQIELSTLISALYTKECMADLHKEAIIEGEFPKFSRSYAEGSVRAEKQLQTWLPLIMDICCAYRGYKNGVEVRSVFIAGNRLESELAYSSDGELVKHG